LAISACTAKRMERRKRSDDVSSSPTTPGGTGRVGPDELESSRRNAEVCEHGNDAKSSQCMLVGGVGVEVAIAGGYEKTLSRRGVQVRCGGASRVELNEAKQKTSDGQSVGCRRGIKNGVCWGLESASCCPDGAWGATQQKRQLQRAAKGLATKQRRRGCIGDRCVHVGIVATTAPEVANARGVGSAVHLKSKLDEGTAQRCWTR